MGRTCKNNRRPPKVQAYEGGGKPRGGREWFGPIGGRQARNRGGGGFPRLQRFQIPWTWRDLEREYLAGEISEGREERREYPR